MLRNSLTSITNLSSQKPLKDSSSLQVFWRSSRYPTKCLIRKNLPEPGLPESFKVLVRELKGLALDVRIYDESGNEIDIEKL